MVFGLAFCALLFSGCDVLESYQFEGSLVPTESEEIDFAGAITSADIVTIDLATDCTTDAEEDPASGQVAIDDVTYAAVNGICSDRVVVEPTELGSEILVTIDGEQYTFQVVGDGIIDAAGAWVVEDVEGARFLAWVFEFSADSPIVPGDKFLTVLDLDNVAETVYGGVLSAPVVTPETIVDFVNEQRDAGAIGNGDANPVLNHLDQMTKALDKGKTKQAQKKLDKLIERAENNAGDPFYDALLSQLQAINPL